MKDLHFRDLALPASASADTPVRAAQDETTDPAYRARVEEAAQKFESFFIAQMLRQMRSATRELAGEDSIYGKRSNDDMLDLADTSFADALASQRAFGIADVIVRQMLPAEPAQLLPPLQGGGGRVSQSNDPCCQSGEAEPRLPGRGGDGLSPRRRNPSPS